MAIMGVNRPDFRGRGRGLLYRAKQTEFAMELNVGKGRHPVVPVRTPSHAFLPFPTVDRNQVRISPVTQQRPILRAG